MKQNRQIRVGLGAASLIMILLVLCLVLMGVLSLMSARADLDLSRRHAKLAEGYAEASADAQRALAELDALLAEAHAKSADEAQYAALCMDVGSAGSTSVEWEDDTTPSCTWTPEKSGSSRCVSSGYHGIWQQKNDTRSRRIG